MASPSIFLMKREPTHREHMEVYAKMIWDSENFRDSDPRSKNAYLLGMSMGSKAEAAKIVRGWLEETSVTGIPGEPTVSQTPTWTIPANVYGIRVRFVGADSGGNLSVCGILGTLVAPPAGIGRDSLGRLGENLPLFVQHGKTITFAKEEDLIVACQFCGKDGIHRCGGCKKTFFCSTRCQKKCWKEHKAVCTSTKPDGMS